MSEADENGPFEVAPDVWRITLPTPWQVGSVNVHVIDDDPFTLVDTGQCSAVAIERLEAGLHALGRRIEDVERLILSHQHIDHWGLAQVIVERSGAEVCALDELAAWIAAYPESLMVEEDYYDALLREHGVDPTVTSPAERSGLGFGAPIETTRPVHDGDVIEFAQRRLRVLRRPGHSESDTVFHDEEREMLFGADHLLAWPSTPMLAPPIDGSPLHGRPRAFADYLASLRATDELALELILPGHGDSVRRPHDVIADRFARYGRVQEKVRAALGPEPRGALDISATVRGPADAAVAYFILCDVLGHLDALLDAGAAVEERDADGVARYVAA